MAKACSTRSTSARSDPVEDAFATSAQWYDGRTAVRHQGTARWDGAGHLALRAPTSQIDVALGELQFTETRGASRLYRRVQDDGFRLTLPAALPPGLAAHLPSAGPYGAWIDRMGLGKAVVAFTLASTAAVALFVTAPDWLGPRIPESWERKIGTAMVGDLGGRMCHTPAGDAAMAKLLAAVDPGKTKVRAGVANIDMVNAIALPGGQVVLFSGIVTQAKSPDELAGVLAHEVGHVRERHVMTALMRQFGLSILLAGTNSNVTSSLAGLASMGYSREAEREADEYARARLAQSDISPVPTAGFFERMAKEAGEPSDDESDAVIGWMASHPAARDRAKAFRAAADKRKMYRPVLTPQEFAALRQMCNEDPDAEEFEFF